MLDLVHEVREATDVDSFAERALASLTELVPCDEITFNDLDFERGEAEYERTLPASINTAGVLQVSKRWIAHP